MSELAEHYTDEKTGISYTLVGDYYIPDLKLPDNVKYDMGRFGRMRKSYLKNHRPGLYTDLRTAGVLNEHLSEIDQAANNRLWIITKQMAIAEGLTEQLKAEDQMLWIQKANNIRARAEEIVREELIYA